MCETSSKIRRLRRAGLPAAAATAGATQGPAQLLSPPSGGKAWPCRVRLGGVLGVPDLLPGFLPCSLGGASTPSSVSLSQQKPSYSRGFPGGTTGEESACQCRRRGRLGLHPQVKKIPWRRKRQPAPVFLPGESHGHRSLAGDSPWGHKESDTTELSD